MPVRIPAVICIRMPGRECHGRKMRRAPDLRVTFRLLPRATLEPL
jgi:hypothetical protein